MSFFECNLELRCHLNGRGPRSHNWSRDPFHHHFIFTQTVFYFCSRPIALVLETWKLLVLRLIDCTPKSVEVYGELQTGDSRRFSHAAKKQEQNTTAFVSN